MNNKIINYYTCGNTAKGFYDLFESSLQGLDKIFILKGGPGTGKSSLIKKIGEVWVSKGYDIEFIHCSSDNNSLDGVIIPKLKVGIVDGTAPHVIEPKAPGAIEDYVNLGVAWNSDYLKDYKNTIIDIKQLINECYKQAYCLFEKALTIHDEWEKIYIANMDFAKADKLTEEIINTLLQNHSLIKSPIIKHRFMGGSTPKGARDFVENLTSSVSKRYFIKGRPGSGKSTLLKKLARRAEERGFDVEVYHCGFDPNSLDMVILRELDVCIFDSTAPHEYFPSRDSDEIIDMYSELITQGTDEKYSEELKSIVSRYKRAISEGTSFLSKAKSLHDDLEKIYISSMNFHKINEIVKDINDKIADLAK